MKYIYMHIFISDEDKHRHGQWYGEFRDYGYITPPYQENGQYDYNIHVTWSIVADTDQVVFLNFLYVDIEGGKQLSWDTYYDLIIVSV